MTTPSKRLLRNENNQGLIALWMGRALLNRDLRRRIRIRDYYHYISGSAFASIFESKPYESDEDGNPKKFLTALIPTLKEITCALTAERLQLSGTLGTNIRALGKLLNISELEQNLLGVFILLQTNETFREVTRGFSELTRQELCEILAIMLDTPRLQIVRLLKRDARLHSSGLLKVDSNTQELHHKADLLDNFADLICSEEQEPLELLRGYFSLSEPAQLNLNHFPHLAEQAQNVLNYLQKRPNSRGVNILIYGEPGTGKTQWVKALAQQINAPLYEIASEDDEEERVRSKRRVDMYKLAQCALEKQTKGLILFDEVEDVFPSDYLMFMLGASRNSKGKAWINKLLENNPVPSFWISNAIYQIDEAYLRRFDLVIEISVPPYHVRRDILSNILTHLPVEAQWIDEIAKEDHLVPALVERAAKVTKAMMPRTKNAAKLQNKVMSLINNTLQAQGKKEIRLKNTKATLDYSLQLINTNANLEKLVQGIQQQKQGRILLYGMPGTGKTAFGHHLAEQLEKPLLIKRASDLLSPYVGQAEINMAEAFRQARQEDAILQIDEADSFLQSRDNAVRSWEVTQVNEMLTQMEAFEGVFIASTNLMDNLDAAAMRRFDVKLEFKPLTANQSLLLFQQLFKNSSLSNKELEKARQQIAQLKQLTPGDFAAVKRKFSLGYQDLDLETALEALREECSFKPGYSKMKGIGFMSELPL